MTTRRLTKVRLTYYTGAVFRLYPQIPPVWIDASRRKCFISRNENESDYASNTRGVVNSTRSNLSCQSAHGHLEAQRRQIEVRARRNQKYHGHLHPDQR